MENNIDFNKIERKIKDKYQSTDPRHSKFTSQLIGSIMMGIREYHNQLSTEHIDKTINKDEN